MRTLPDGTILWTHRPIRAPDVITSFVIDPATLMLKTMTTIDDRKGKKTLSRKSTIRNELHDGIYRVTSIDIERGEPGPSYFEVTDDFEDDPEKSQKAILLSTIGTIEVEWIQFNERQLRFPTDDEVGRIVQVGESFYV